MELFGCVVASTHLAAAVVVVVVVVVDGFVRFTFQNRIGLTS